MTHSGSPTAPAPIPTKLAELARVTAFDAPTIERTAMWLHRASALMEDGYDGWFPESDTEENWRSLLIEAERDRIREVAAEFLTAGFLPDQQVER